MARASVIGTTSWGTTLAVLLARNGNQVTLYARTAAEASELEGARENTRRRPGLAFPTNLEVAADGPAPESDLVVVAVPSATLRANLERLHGKLRGQTTVLSATKGIEPETCLRMSEVITNGGIESERVLALSGPNFASEIAAGLPAATVVAGRRDRAEQAQALLNGRAFRVYTSDDIVGVELGGALKNVIAIACGLADGLGYGENAKAALITRGLAEMSRLGVTAGAQPMTFLGLAGIGDLVLSCESNLSRNRRLGLALAQGQSLAAATESIGIVEGAVTAKAIPRLARQLAVEMPICQSLHAVLYEGKPPAEAGRELMARAARPELDER